MPFEDDLGEALRQAGGGFTPDRHALVTAGEQRGRRLVARRRAAVVGGSVLGLALIGTVGAYTGGRLGGSDGAGTANVAAPPALPSSAPGRGPGRGTGAVSGDQMVAWLKQLLPGGQLSDAKGMGSEAIPSAYGVYDDGKGKAAIGVSLNRADPNGETTAAMFECPDKNKFEYDDCTSETLADGSRVLVYQGYEYPNRSEPTKSWQATLVTPQGYQVEVREWNAPAEKGEPVSRPNPPLTPAQLKALALAPQWRPALDDLPPARPEPARSDPGPGTSVTTGTTVTPILESLLTGYAIPVVAKGGESEHANAYAVLDDGKGKSMVFMGVQPNLQPSTTDDLFAGATTMPDGTRVVTRQEPGEKGIKNVVMWTVDALRTNGTRVTVSAINAKNQESDATRQEPALTMAQLKEIATSDKWAEYGK